jgi:hypothetical protein
MDESAVLEGGIRKYWSHRFSKLGISPITHSRGEFRVPPIRTGPESPKGRPG